jgi:hypothetical protein
MRKKVKKKYVYELVKRKEGNQIKKEKTESKKKKKGVNFFFL